MTDRFFHRAALARPAAWNRWPSVRELRPEPQAPLIFSCPPCLSPPRAPRPWALAAIPPPPARLQLAPAQAAVASAQVAQQPRAGSPLLEPPAREAGAPPRPRYSNG